MSRTLRTASVAALEAVPGLAHGFEERLGPSGWETREASRARVASALAQAGRLFLLRQVHGTAIHEAPWDGFPEGDGGIAARRGTLVGVETADCLPILLVDPVRRVAAALHAGWRGTAASIARRGVEALAARGSRAEDLLAALGPGIGACCYEVGDELRDAFGDAGAPFFRPGPRGRPHLDVRGLNARQLEGAGVPRERIHHVPHCTFCEADRYHSFRRDGREAGRMIHYVGWAA